VRTFWLQTLGCKVNHYESEQIAAVLRAAGLTETDAACADLRIVNTCSITTEAASKSRQSIRRAVRLPVLQSVPAPPSGRARVVVVGCWATSNRPEAALLPGVTAVITHHDDVAARLQQLLADWKRQDLPPSAPLAPHATPLQSPSLIRRTNPDKVLASPPVGTRSLPLLHQRQSHQQRAFLKIQDGCDARCTYCIIPTLRPSPWSKPPADVLQEAQRLVDAGHVEIVLTGIFLGAYGHATALRRRQEPGRRQPLAQLIEDLCTRVRGLRRLRLSSLEPGDLSDDLLRTLQSHGQVVPHFHLPLQSGSNRLLKRMNRQYLRDDYLRLLDAAYEGFDRPAITTDIIVGFPGESDAEFAQTLDVVQRARFIHMHAFAYSARPGTAAARWQRDFVPAPIANRRLELLNRLAQRFSFEYRAQFIGQSVAVLVERDEADASGRVPMIRHGRSARYFDVQFPNTGASPGDLVAVRVDEVTQNQTLGTIEPSRGLELASA